MNESVSKRHEEGNAGYASSRAQNRQTCMQNVNICTKANELIKQVNGCVWVERVTMSAQHFVNIDWRL